MKRRLGLGLLVALTAALAAVVTIGGPAQAHNYLIGSTPVAGSTITTLPQRIEVTTNDTLLDLAGKGAGFDITVQDAAGKFYGDGCITISGPSISTGAALGAAGKYTVTWQVISTDSHPVSNAFTFSWAPTDAAQQTAGSSTPPNCHGTRTAATPQPQSATSAGSGGGSTTIFWIGGAVLAVIVAAGVTLLVVRPRPSTGSGTD